jgi:glycosyltransferase 2 family protein
LLVLVASQVDFSSARSRIAHGDRLAFAVGCACIVGMFIIGAVRWWILLRAAAVESRFRYAARAFAIGTFSNTFLPTSIGGDAARAWAVAPPGRGLVESLTTVALDRLLALVGMMIVAWAGFAADPANVPRRASVLLAWITAGAVVGIGVALVGHRMRSLRWFAARLPARLGEFAGRVGAALGLYRRSLRVLAVSLALSIAMQLLLVANVYLMARAISVDVPFTVLAVVSALVVVVTLLPISIAGVGLREGAFVVLLAPLGVKTTDATLVSVLVTTVLTVASLPCALAFFLPGRRWPVADIEAPGVPC